ncbi:Conserved hypothetical, protein [Geosmithia morbida]|uniref:Conserved hypothetical, protein n=1 Tax=Geosmithia morbida TaxID=1094350 RepID=A0A9P4YRA5_9HYPO|nr:Conserved hypothetical, protein [Geosmithia morbida]KAF4120161.1 Conserved hypothetical, protein [Geosmithia morbida]
MLAAHRDQENLVHSHQAGPGKQQMPKTPGARYPKTPLRPGHNDENAPTAFAGKTGLGGTKAGNTMTKGNGNQGLSTPMGKRALLPDGEGFHCSNLSHHIGQRSRAPLGAKTTNAKARAAPDTGVKGIVKEIEKTALKQPTAQKPKPKSALQIEVKNDPEPTPQDGEEPEYAPPRPAELPYESDLLPKGGLSMEGLKRENLFLGYYEHFINPIDENGVSRRDRQLKDEMRSVMDRAVRKNQKDLDEVDWNTSDSTQSTTRMIKQKPDAPEVAEAKMARKVRVNPVDKQQPSTIRARKAASTLAVHTDGPRKTAPRKTPTPTVAPARRPLSSLMTGRKPAKSNLQEMKTRDSNNTAAEAASRTTLGYNKGKSASGMVHPRAPSQASSVSGRSTTKTPVRRDDESDLTITPARIRPAEQHRPRFTSIFEPESDDEDLAPLAGPAMLGDDDDEEFELKLDL